MIECMRLIIGEVGTREREREGLKIGRSAFEVVQGQTATWRKTRRNLFDTRADPVVKELGKA